MKRNRKRKRNDMRLIRLWTYPQANKALPYLHSITGSLREHWLEAQDKRLEVNRMQKEPGRVDRGRILAEQFASEEKSKAEERFAEDLQELLGLDVFLLDPVQGVAFIPFQKDTELAWFVYDHFGNDLKSWRFHQDPLETRRPIQEVVPDPAVNPSLN
ncbi:MAG: DUF2203 family protein [Planctomycetes bacterium]|nr:DUF2203 family protein [Planctomycetota bacterium]